MFNHFCMFASADEAREALAAFVLVDGTWDLARVIPDQRVVLQRATWRVEDETPVVDRPEITVPGYFVTVSLPAIETSIRDLPGHACRLIGDSDRGALVYTAPDLDAGMLATAIIEPVPAGSSYSFNV